MSNQPAIMLQNITKTYKLFHSNTDRFKEAFFLGKKKYHNEFCAIQNINLVIPKGHTVGIVGRNGSGKSTLLQIIASIIKPTRGTIQVQGKIAALLELGTGFHPDLTGLQNITLNCTLMGLTPIQIEERIEAIQAFADIDEFMSQPLRTYSSGMKARLAFATAIHVDPDILIVDEALAVGDAKFQQKCYQKFLDFQHQGKTILLVTHDTHAILRYCNLAILLDKGSLLQQGEPKEIINMYSELFLCGSITPKAPSTPSPLEQAHVATHAKDPSKDEGYNLFFNRQIQQDRVAHHRLYNKNEYRFGDGRAKIVDVLVCAKQKNNPMLIDAGTMTDVYLKVVFDQEVLFPMVGLSIKTPNGTLVCAINTRFLKIDLRAANAQDIRIYKLSIKMDLHPGDWFLDIGVAEKLPGEDVPCDIRNNALHIQVTSRHHHDGLIILDNHFKEITADVDWQEHVMPA